jgi:septal ring factor EnvC (AmiA/AmiB activator)
MKHIILFFSFFLFANTHGICQIGPATQKEAPEKSAKEAKPTLNTPTAKAKDNAKKLTKSLKLNETQQASLEKALIEYETQVSNTNKSKLTNKEKYVKNNDLNMKRQAAIKKILSPEQYKAYLLSYP